MCYRFCFDQVCLAGSILSHRPNAEDVSQTLYPSFVSVFSRISTFGDPNGCSGKAESDMRFS